MKLQKEMHRLLGLLLVVLGVGLIIVFSSIGSSFNDHGVFLCEAVGANPSLDMAECPAHTSNIPFLVSIGYVFGSFVVLVGLVLVFLLRFVTSVQNKEFDVSDLGPLKLDSDERKVCEVLIGAGGSMYQSELITKTEFSKVKMTRVLDSLEHQRRVVERKRRGMTNLVVFKEK